MHVYSWRLPMKSPQLISTKGLLQLFCLPEIQLQNSWSPEVPSSLSPHALTQKVTPRIAYAQIRKYIMLCYISYFSPSFTQMCINLDRDFFLPCNRSWRLCNSVHKAIPYFYFWLLHMPLYGCAIIYFSAAF